MKKMSLEEFLTVEQAGALLQMHPGAVRKAILAERIAARRFGARLLLIARVEVERYRVERPPRGRRPKSQTSSI